MPATTMLPGLPGLPGLKVEKGGHRLSPACPRVFPADLPRLRHPGSPPNAQARAPVPWLASGSPVWRTFPLLPAELPEGLEGGFSGLSVTGGPEALSQGQKNTASPTSHENRSGWCECLCGVLTTAGATPGRVAGVVDTHVSARHSRSWGGIAWGAPPFCPWQGPQR